MGQGLQYAPLPFGDKPEQALKGPQHRQGGGGGGGGGGLPGWLSAAGWVWNAEVGAKGGGGGGGCSVPKHECARMVVRGSVRARTSDPVAASTSTTTPRAAWVSLRTSTWSPTWTPEAGVLPYLHHHHHHNSNSSNSSNNCQ